MRGMTRFGPGCRWLHVVPSANICGAKVRGRGRAAGEEDVPLRAVEERRLMPDEDETALRAVEELGLTMEVEGSKSV